MSDGFAAVSDDALSVAAASPEVEAAAGVASAEADLSEDAAGVAALSEESALFESPLVESAEDTGAAAFGSVGY